MGSTSNGNEQCDCQKENRLLKKNNTINHFFIRYQFVLMVVRIKMSLQYLFKILLYYDHIF